MNLAYDPENGILAPDRSTWPDLCPYKVPGADGPLLIYGIATDTALHFLFAEEIIFLGNAGEGRAGLFVGCNDVFSPAADAEPLPCPLGYAPRGQETSPNDEAWLDLYRRVKEHGSWGAMTWVALRRKQGPWRKSIRESWIQSGAWDPIIDSFGGAT